jgi:glucose/arabinose dehydrogenase/mono/diheme cytochrome c family protein
MTASSRSRALVVTCLLLAFGACSHRGGERETSCRPPTIKDAYPIAFTPLFDGIELEKPIRMRPDPRERDAWIVGLARGELLRIAGENTSTALEIAVRVELGQQWGLQDFVLHPRFPEDRRVFVSYLSRDLVSVVSAFRLGADGVRFDAGSETVLLSEEQSDTPWHPVAALDFGPDGLLYVSWGYGEDRSQDVGRLGGKLLRIDVDRRDNDKPYAIPPSNPTIRDGARGEIFALGLRNPWRFGIDRESGEIWLGDVGDRTFEEIDKIEPGKNYGWPVLEGSACVGALVCSNEGLAPPFAVHTHSEFCSITGGTVYRGRALPALYGKYIYANYCTGAVWALEREGERSGAREVVGYAGGSVGSFAEDADGELYVVHTNDENIDGRDSADGVQIRKLVPNTHAADDARAPATLAESGCVHRRGHRQAPMGMLSYRINHPPFDDGAEARRFVTRRPSTAVPGDTLPLYAPEGSVLMKTLERGGRPVETQMLARRADGGWNALDYEWSDDATDATVVLQAKTKLLPDGTSWTFPGPEGCALCHSGSAEMLLGFRLPQLDLARGGKAALERLEDRGVIRWREGDTRTPRIPARDDPSISVEERARAYLQVNCAHCHGPSARAGESRMDLRMGIPLADMRVCNARPTGLWPAHENAMLVAPGRPEDSLLSLRLRAIDATAMPPQRHVLDASGADSIDAWIRGLRGCS